MAALKTLSATTAFAVQPTFEQRAVSCLPRTLRSFRPVCSRASCSWARSGNLRYGRAPSALRSSQTSHLQGVGAFSTSYDRRSKLEESTSSTSNGQQVGHDLHSFIARSQQQRHVRMRVFILSQSKIMGAAAIVDLQFSKFLYLSQPSQHIHTILL